MTYSGNGQKLLNGGGGGAAGQTGELKGAELQRETREMLRAEKSSVSLSLYLSLSQVGWVHSGEDLLTWIIQVSVQLRSVCHQQVLRLVPSDEA